MHDVQPDIQLHIERLVLDGLPMERAQGPLVRAALEAELARLLTENGLGAALASGGAMPSVPASAMHLASAGNPSDLGIGIARSVYGGIGRGS